MDGGFTLVATLVANAPGYFDNLLRHDLWRAEPAHAGVHLVLSLVMLLYVDEAGIAVREVVCADGRADRGVQYACGDHIDLLQQGESQISMERLLGGRQTLTIAISA